MAHRVRRRGAAVSSEKPTAFHRLTYFDAERGVLRYASTLMCTADDLERFPGAEPDLDTIEWRSLPERPEEWQTAGSPDANSGPRSGAPAWESDQT